MYSQAIGNQNAIIVNWPAESLKPANPAVSRHDAKSTSGLLAFAMVVIKVCHGTG
jgi:hypothetical protein